MKNILYSTTALISILAAQPTLADSVNDLSDNGPLEIYVDNDETGDAQFRIRAGDIGADGNYTGGDVLFEIKPDANYSNATSVGDVMTTINTDATISGDATLNGVVGAADGTIDVSGNIMLLDGDILSPYGKPIELKSTGNRNAGGVISLEASSLTGEDQANAEILLLADGDLVNTIDLSATGTDGQINLKAGDNSSELTMSDTSATLTVSGTNGNLGSAAIIVDTVNAYPQKRSINGSEYFDQSIILMTESTGGTNVGDIDILSGDDVGIEALDKIVLKAADDIEMEALDDIEMSVLQDFELVKNLGEDSSGTPYGSGIIALQGSNANRYVADANGKIVLVDDNVEWSDEWEGDWDQDSQTANTIHASAESLANIQAGTSAQLLVGDAAGNMRGLVVQENKTTLSGGQNAASLSLDENGATFSDPKNGKPIQVHGVADGTAEFDAVNVRQLYSGLAAVLAAGTPELRLEPGKTSAAVGVGYYGGYSGIGLGLGHMYDDGTVVSMSVGKATHSEVAVKGSVSWTW